MRGPCLVFLYMHWYDFIFIYLFDNILEIIGCVEMYESIPRRKSHTFSSLNETLTTRQCTINKELTLSIKVKNYIIYVYTLYVWLNDRLGTTRGKILSKFVWIVYLYSPILKFFDHFYSIQNRYLKVCFKHFITIKI